MGPFGGRFKAAPLSGTLPSPIPPVLLLLALALSACATLRTPHYESTDRTFRDPEGLILALPAGWRVVENREEGAIFQATYSPPGPTEMTLTLRSEQGIPSLQDLNALEEEKPDALKIGAPFGTYANPVLLFKRTFENGGRQIKETLWVAERLGFPVFIERISAVAGLTAFHLRFEIPAPSFEPFEEAVRVLIEGIEWHPRLYSAEKTAEAYRALGEGFIGQKRFKEAVRVLQRALDLSPRDGTVYLLLADAAREAGETALSERAYREAIRLRPSDPLPYRGLARLLQKTDAREAIALLEKATGLASLDASLYEDLGRILLETKRPQEARENFLKAIRRDRTLAEARVGLGRSYREMGKNDLAVNAFQEALRLKPSLRDLHCELLEIYTLEGYGTEAEKEKKLCPTPSARANPPSGDNPPPREATP